MFNLMDLASKYLDIDKLTAGMSRSYSKSDSSDGSYVLKRSRRRKKKKPKNKKKIIIIKKKLQIPEPPKIIFVPQRVKRVKAKSAVTKNSSTSTKSMKKAVKSHSEKRKSMPGQKGDTKKRSKKSNSSTVQEALKDFKKKKSQFLESLKLLQQHLSSVKAEDFLKNTKNKEKSKKDVFQKTTSESEVKIKKPKAVQNEKIQKSVPFCEKFSESSNNLIECPGHIEEAVAVFPYQVCQVGFLENKKDEMEKRFEEINYVNELKFDVENMKYKMEDTSKKTTGNQRLDSIVRSMKGMLPKCTVYRGRQ